MSQLPAATDSRTISQVTAHRLLLAACALSLLGCAADPIVMTPSVRSEALLLPPLATAMEQPLGTWTLHLDPASLHAELTPDRGATAGEQSYLLALDEVLPANTIQVAELARIGDALHLTYTVTHPFPGPDITRPVSAANRADLGFAGRCVFGLAPTSPIPGQTSFYDGDVVLEPSVLDNADGYCAIGAAIPWTGKSATAFPYQVLVDERGAGSRVGLSNGGKATGNYQPIVDGWQRPNMGTGGQIRWTGYGFLHQGQSVRRTLILDASALDAYGAPLDVQVHLLAKYTDPRGGATVDERIANRLPGTLSDPTEFMYRLPYAALDVSEVAIAAAGNGLLPNDPDSEGWIAIHVVDWDARASESSASSWADETEPAVVPVGTSGVPAVRLDLPGVISTPADLDLADDDVAWGGDAGVDKGHPGDELAFSALITNALGTGGSQSPGYYRGLLEVTDPEAALDRSDWELALGTDLVPLTGAAPTPITWQVIEVPVGDFGVVGCPDAPKSGTDLTQPPAFQVAHELNADPGTFFTSFGPLDFGSFRTNDYSGILFQAYHDGTGEVTTEHYDLYSINAATGALTQLSSFGTSYKERQWSQIETTSTNRILFTTLEGATLFSDINLVYAYADLDINYFDYAGSPVTTTPQKIRTTSERMVAIAVDAQDQVWGVDHQNRLHCFKPIPSGYQRDTSRTIDLPTALNLADPFFVCDFAINFHNGAFYFLIKPDDGLSGAASVYRLECDGSLRASINGHANPLPVTIYELGGTLSIDNHSSTGAILDGQQDSQMLIGGYAEPYDLYVVTADLQITAQLFSQSGAMEFQPEYCGTRALSRLEVAGVDTVDAYALPSGWQ